MSQSTLTKRALAASLKALLREEGFEKITVDAICENAGVSRRSFYRHFADKYELLSWIYYGDFVRHNAHHDDWTILDYLPSICEELIRDRAFYNNAFAIEGQNSFRSFCIELLTPLIKHDFEDVFLSDESAGVYIEMVCNTIFDSYQSWLASENPLPVDEYVSYLRRSMGATSRRLAEICEAEPKEPERWA